MYTISVFFFFVIYLLITTFFFFRKISKLVPFDEILIDQIAQNQVVLLAVPIFGPRARSPTVTTRYGAFFIERPGHHFGRVILCFHFLLATPIRQLEQFLFCGSSSGSTALCVVEPIQGLSQPIGVVHQRIQIVHEDGIIIDVTRQLVGLAHRLNARAQQCHDLGQVGLEFARGLGPLLSLHLQDTANIVASLVWPQLVYQVMHVNEQ